VYLIESSLASASCRIPRGLCRLTLLLLFEPELFERLTTMVDKMTV
jgi:hypothetical protein